MNTVLHPVKGLSVRGYLRGHSDSILRLVWMQDGRRLVSASVDNSLRVWDSETETELQRLNGQPNSFTGVALTPDNQSVITLNWHDTDLYLWHLPSQQLYMTLTGHRRTVTSALVSPNGRYLVSTSDDRTLIIWELPTGRRRHILEGHQQCVLSAVLHPDGDSLFSASEDGTVRLWNIHTGQALGVWQGHSHWVTVLALSPDGNFIASGSADTTIRLWDRVSGQCTHVLTAHSGQITQLSFSGDGRLLASKAMDNSVRLWRTDTWEVVQTFAEASQGGRGYEAAGLAFHPYLPLLASLGENDESLIRLWRFDYATLVGQHPYPRTYLSAKIALLGDSNTGKTSLHYTLTGRTLGEGYATPYQHACRLEEASLLRADGTYAEALLVDYNTDKSAVLLNTLACEETDIVVLAFDPATDDENWSSLNTWTRQIQCASTPHPPIILVETRQDHWGRRLDEEEARLLCQRLGVTGGYIATSASTRQGLDQLLNQIRALLPWQDISQQVDWALFERARSYMESLKAQAETAPLLLALPHLAQEMESDNLGWSFTRAELERALRHLQKHGYIALLKDPDTDETFILTAPEKLLELGDELFAEARRGLRGVGLLQESRLWGWDYPLKTLAALRPAEKRLLLSAVLERLLKQDHYFSDVIQYERWLIFPQIYRSKRPLESQVLKPMAFYQVRGYCATLYAGLLVQMNMSRSVRRSYQWGGRFAQFENGGGELCAFTVTLLGPHQAEISLSYAESTPTFTRNIFEGILEEYLSSHQLSYERYPVPICPHCGYRPPLEEVCKMLNARQVFCMQCGELIPLKTSPESPALPSHRAQELPSYFAQVLEAFRLYLHERLGRQTSCFVSHAWGNPQHEGWVRRLADHLRRAGVSVSLDLWEDSAALGEAIENAIQHSDFVLLVGTDNYGEKWRRRDPRFGSAVASEIEAIRQRLHQSQEQVLPLLLQGDPSQNFPPPLNGQRPLLFREERFYFINIQGLLFRLYRQPLGSEGDPNDPTISELIAYIRSLTKAEGPS
jgi:WD40 repeat protein